MTRWQRRAIFCFFLSESSKTIFVERIVYKVLRRVCRHFPAGGSVFAIKRTHFSLFLSIFVLFWALFFPFDRLKRSKPGGVGGMVGMVGTKKK